MNINMNMLKDEKTSKHQLNVFLNSLSTQASNTTGRKKFLLTPFLNLFNYKVVTYNYYSKHSNNCEFEYFNYFAYTGDYVDNNDSICLKIKLLKSLTIASKDKETFESKLKLRIKQKTLNDIPVLTNGVEYYLYIYTGNKYELYWYFNLLDMVNNEIDVSFNRLIKSLSYGIEYSFNYEDKLYSKFYHKRKEYLDKIERLKLEKKQLKLDKIIDNLNKYNLSENQKQLFVNLFNEEEFDLLNSLECEISRFINYKNTLNLNTLILTLTKNINKYFSCIEQNNMLYLILDKYIEELYLHHVNFVSGIYEKLDIKKKHYAKEKAKYSPKQRKELLSNIDTLDIQILNQLEYWECLITKIAQITGGNYDDYTI